MKFTFLTICLIVAYSLQIPKTVNKNIRNLSKKVIEGNLNISGSTNLSQKSSDKKLFQKMFAKVNKSLSKTIMDAYSAQIYDALNYKLAQSVKSQINIAQNVTKLVEMGIDSLADKKGLSQAEINMENRKKSLALKKALAQKGLSESAQEVEKVCTSCENPNKNLSQKRARKEL